jgi:hypothetical protein
MKLKLKGHRFDTIEETQAELQRVLDILTEKDCQKAFQKWTRRRDRCLHAGGDHFVAADRPYEFYDFYGVSPEYFGYTLLRYRSKFSRSGDLAPKICVQITLILFVDVILGVSRSSCIVDIRWKGRWWNLQVVSFWIRLTGPVVKMNTT